jgi:hypothetical protein
MPMQRDYWPEWAQFLKKRGLENMTAWLLEAGSPLALIGSQLLYIGQPLLNPMVPLERTEALAHMLEDKDEFQAFLAYLKNGAAS